MAPSAVSASSSPPPTRALTSRTCGLPTAALLATANFSGESASGWQQVNFSPVNITAGTHYVASYHTTTGHYAGDASYFTNRGFDNAPLHALQNGVDGGNGVYVYGNGTTFPSNSYKSSNYWVDVVFNTSGGGGGDTTPPNVSSRSPASGATNVSVSTAVTATFNEAVQEATIVFTLKRTSNGAAVTAPWVYNASNRTATLQPTAPLAAAVQYTATVSGAKDAAGNTMASTSWSFTTAATGSVNCPCTIWPSSAAPVVAADPDNIGTEVGVKFRADVSGTITGIRFYKSTTNTGDSRGPPVERNRHSARHRGLQR